MAASLFEILSILGLPCFSGLLTVTTLFAETLPERQQAKVFNKEKLRPLLDALLSIKRELDEKDLERRRKRLLQIFNLLFSAYICKTAYVLSLAGRERKILSATQSFAADMQALYIASTRSE